MGPKRRRYLAALESSTRETGNDPRIFAEEVARAIEDEEPALRVVIGEKAKKFIEARRSMPEASFRNMIAERSQLS